MTRPMPTSAATDVKSTVSSGAAAYDGSSADFDASRVCSVAELCTGRLPQRRDGGGELLAAIVGRGEHIERRASRREQHDVAGRAPDVARALHRLFHRERLDDRHDAIARPRESIAAASPIAISVLTRPANLRSQRVEVAALRASAGDQDDRPVVGAQRRDDRRRICRLRIVHVADAVDRRRRFPGGATSARTCAIAARNASGRQPIASAANNAAIAFSTLCSPGSGISAARHDRRRAVDRRRPARRSASRRAGTSSPRRSPAG